jgi:hypothetical protein
MYRLIYKSRSVGNVDWDVIKDILHSCEANNLRREITGILLATGKHYLQILEGRYEEVNRTFMDIVQDERHDDIRLIAFNIIEARLFESWGMKGIGIFDLNREEESTLKEKYGEENDGIKFPLEEWRVLAMINDINLVHQAPEWKS